MDCGHIAQMFKAKPTKISVISQLNITVKVVVGDHGSVCVCECVRVCLCACV